MVVFQVLHCIHWRLIWEVEKCFAERIALSDEEADKKLERGADTDEGASNTWCCAAHMRKGVRNRYPWFSRRIPETSTGERGLCFLPIDSTSSVFSTKHFFETSACTPPLSLHMCFASEIHDVTFSQPRTLSLRTPEEATQHACTRKLPAHTCHDVDRIKLSMGESRPTRKVDVSHFAHASIKL